MFQLIGPAHGSVTVAVIVLPGEYEPEGIPQVIGQVCATATGARPMATTGAKAKAKSSATTPNVALGFLIVLMATPNPYLALMVPGYRKV